ncbi:MAG: hypothetical protein GWP14_04225, partial [Actinobacteria bacterium]|nr:hypothetical protein [Actinomycetota bacterium]
MSSTPLSNRWSSAVLLLVVCFTFLACVSYSWSDWPSTRLAPPVWPGENRCGPVGAWISYQVFSLLGYSVFVLLIFGGVFSVLRLLNRPVSDFYLRVAGLGLLVLSFSAVGHLLSPSFNFPAENPLPFTAGGVVGSALGSFLLRQLSRWGSALVLTAALAVGLLLAADTSVGFVLRLIRSQLALLS